MRPRRASLAILLAALVAIGLFAALWWYTGHLADEAIAGRLATAEAEARFAMLRSASLLGTAVAALGSAAVAWRAAAVRDAPSDGRLYRVVAVASVVVAGFAAAGFVLG